MKLINIFFCIIFSPFKTNDHDILNYIILYNNPLFKEFVLRHGDSETVLRYLRDIKKNYCTDQKFQLQIKEMLSFDLIDEIEDLCTNYGLISAPLEIEDCYNEYKNFSYGNNPINERYQNRCHALTHQYEKGMKQITLHPLTEQLLDKHDVSLKKFKHFKGNVFQIQLFEEFNEMLETMATAKQYSSELASVYFIMIIWVNLNKAI